MARSTKVILAHIGCSGFVTGRLLFYKGESSFQRPALAEPPEVEDKRWQTARRHVSAELKRQIRYLRNNDNPQARAAVGVIETHLMALADPVVSREIEWKIYQEKKSAPHAIAEVFEQFIQSLKKIPDLLIQEKARDVEDIKSRLLSCFQQEKKPASAFEGALVYASSLLPGELIELARAGARGFILEQSSPTAHELIVARALEKPLLYGIEQPLSQELEGKTVTLDALHGRLYLYPTKGKAAQIPSLVPPNKIKRGFGVFLNLSLPEELKAIEASPVRQVGLFRSEIFFLEKDKYPSFKEQEEFYREMMAPFSGQLFYFRLFDISQDKKFHRDEKIPLSERSIRYLIKNPDILKTQLKALVRAHERVRCQLVILIPMVSFTEEILFVKKILAKLTSEEIPIAAMLETPASCHMLPFWKNLVYSYNIGTNDLFQFHTGTERHSSDEKSLGYLLHQGNLSLLESLQRQSHGKKVIHCGELLSRRGWLSLLVAMGFRDFSINVAQLPYLLQHLDQIDIDKAKKSLKAICQTDSLKNRIELYLELNS
ncbi:MAG: PEP-utilizing enzyme [Leptospiraceae bacterium]|nr:PEP-utilizing enzyme [Leptospiraceae bacterium]MDW8305742.1 putative PEP-binding protein [Leptospiraceae bacterium]